jgi:hypothetical protein
LSREEKPATLAEKIFGAALSGMFGLGIIGLAGYATWQRIQSIYNAPDLNRDGRFSILDIPAAIWSVILAVGDQYQRLLAETQIGQFLEMRSDQPAWLWSLMLGAFTWWIGFASIAAGLNSLSDD